MRESSFDELVKLPLSGDPTESRCMFPLSGSMKSAPGKERVDAALRGESQASERVHWGCEPARLRQQSVTFRQRISGGRGGVQAPSLRLSTVIARPQDEPPGGSVACRNHVQRWVKACQVVMQRVHREGTPQDKTASTALGLRISCMLAALKYSSMEPPPAAVRMAKACRCHARRAESPCGSLLAGFAFPQHATLRERAGAARSS
eukprot:scaffold3311_cov411-Prasinococcus_capsulatus_cf.AAC.15